VYVRVADALLEESCTSLVRTMYASAENAASFPGALCVEALLELLTHMVDPFSVFSLCESYSLTPCAVNMQMSEPAFDQLRTKEQLGYIVFSGIKKVVTACFLPTFGSF